MNRLGRYIRNTVMALFVLAVLGVGFFLVFPVSGTEKSETEYPQSRIIIPQALEFLLEETTSEQIARIEQVTLKAPLAEGEILVSLLTEDLDGDFQDEQIIVYRSLLETDSSIYYLTYVDMDNTTGIYRRIWTSPVAAIRAGTLSLYTQDLIGDRGVCVLLSGMDSQGEPILVIFRKSPYSDDEEIPAFIKIAEINIDGSINVNVTERTQAYQLGMARGQSYSISAFGRDQTSSNIMDQIEITFNYNEAENMYEQGRITSIPGAQIEQQRVRELLGSQRAFEDFITGLWYYISPQGTLDLRQYIYFDPASREIIFYGDENQQVFIWQNSYSLRYGLSIRGQSISVSTMRRSIDIELESLDSIRVKTFDDVRLNFGVNSPWDGSYRKASNPQNYTVPGPWTNPFIDAVYDSHLGRLHFYPNGNFEINSGGTIKEGKYAFYYLDDDELLELRNYENRTNEIQLVSGSREVYLVEQPAIEVEAGSAGTGPRKTLILSPVRLGSMGVQRLHEGTVTLNLIE